MTRLGSYVLPLIFLGCICSGYAQTFLPKTIQFKGDPEHTNAELLAASGLKTNVPLTAQEMNEHTKLLMDSGLFESINFAFDGQDLTFQIVPVTTLYQPQFENFPFTLDKEIEAKFHELQPLYHGKLPLQGAIRDGMRDALVNELAAKGIQATVSVTPSEEVKPGQTPAMIFSITNPAIRVGEINLDGASSTLAPKARQLAAKNIGTPFSTAGTPSQMEVDLENFYRELGYLEASIHASPLPTPINDDEGVHVPFAISINEGLQYRLGKVTLAADMAVSQDAFDKQSNLHPGEIASLVKLRENWLYVLRQYHNRGYLKAAIRAVPSYDRTQAVVNYLVKAEPGPVYTMGTLKVVNDNEDLRRLLISAWPMSSGATFNEGAILAMTATHDVNPVLEHLFVNNGLRYTLHLHDELRTVDVDLSIERKH